MLSPQKLRIIDLIRGTARRRKRVDPVPDLEALSRRLGKPLRVAVLRVDGIGDWLLTLPLVEGLRDSPHVSAVTLVSVPSHRGLLTRSGFGFESIDVWATHHTPWPHGAVGKVLAISRIGQRRAHATGQRLRGRFDLVVLPRWDTDRGQNLRFVASGMDTDIAGHDPALQRQASAKERKEGRVLTITCQDPREHAHESERITALADNLGINASPDAARGFLGLPQERPANRDIVIMHTSAHDEFRRWPMRSWLDLAGRLLSTTASSIVLVGSPADRAAHDALIALDPNRVRSVAGEVGLDALPALLDSASAFVGNDSGPAHFAAAVGVPTVVVSCFPVGDDPSHPNSPDRFAARSHGGSAVLRPPAQPNRFDDLTDEQRNALISLIDAAQVADAIAQIAETDAHA